MNTINKADKKQAFKEAFLDTMLALSMNFPLNILLVWIAFTLELGVMATSIFLTAVFTTVAIKENTLQDFILKIIYAKRLLTNKLFYGIIYI